MNLLSTHRRIDKSAESFKSTGVGKKTGFFGRTFGGTGTLGDTRQVSRHVVREYVDAAHSARRRRVSRERKAALLARRRARDDAEANAPQQPPRIPRREQHLASTLAFEIYGDMSRAAA